MKGWWLHFPKAFSVAECEALLSYGLTQQPQDASIGYGGGQKVDKEFRTSTVRWLYRHDRCLLDVFQRFDAIFKHANAVSFGLDISTFHEVQLAEYSSVDQGHFNWHEDQSWISRASDPPFVRKLTLAMQLTNPSLYVGGKLELENNELPSGVFEGVGDLLVFPAFLRHRVTRVYEGVRHSLATWAVGPPLR